MPSCFKRVPHGLMITERHGRLANDLTGFMALSGDHEHVARFEAGDCPADRLMAVTDLLGARGRLQDCGPYRAGILAARIIVRHDDAVRLFGGDRAHQWTLAGIAVAAGAE